MTEADKSGMHLVDENAPDAEERMAAARAATEKAKQSMAAASPGEQNPLDATVTELAGVADRMQDDAATARKVFRAYSNMLYQRQAFIVALKQRRPKLQWGASGDIQTEAMKLIQHIDEELDRLRPANFPLLAGDRRVEVRVMNRDAQVTIGDDISGDAVVTIKLKPGTDGAVVAITPTPPTVQPKPKTKSKLEVDPTDNEHRDPGDETDATPTGAPSGGPAGG